MGHDFRPEYRWPVSVDMFERACMAFTALASDDIRGGSRGPIADAMGLAMARDSFPALQSLSMKPDTSIRPATRATELSVVQTAKTRTDSPAASDEFRNVAGTPAVAAHPPGLS